MSNFRWSSWLSRLLVVGIVMLIITGASAVARDTPSACESAKDHWGRVINELNQKLQEYKSIRRNPVDRIIGRPIVDRAAEKPLAKQISEALQIKDELLGGKRKECLNVLNLENQAFAGVERCLRDTGRSKEKELKRLSKKRNRLIQKARIEIAEVREVEGEDYFPQYVDSWGNPTYYNNRGMNAYWRNYRRMQQRYWGN